MRLINTRTLELVERSVDIPPYAILSHTWGEGEVSFTDWSNLDEAREKEGFRKIELTCKQAVEDGLDFAWVDTNCIDKTSSSELSEAINSMFAWYRDAEVCYVFLRDVSVPESLRQTGASTENSLPPKKYLDEPVVKKAFEKSIWFQRGWTLQELLAPSKVVFYSYEWLPLGTKEGNKRLISGVTGIDYDYLTEPANVYTATVARRMSWAARRKTTRIEDTAYCLLGIFGIHMALLYGEQHRAFLRLQEEIIRVSNDQTIFCWQGNTTGSHSNQTVRHLHDDPALYGRGGSEDATSFDSHRRSELEQWTSILAPHPSVFRTSGLYRMGGSNSIATTVADATAPASPAAVPLGPYSITNFGLSIALPLLYTAKGACAVLDVVRKEPQARLSRVAVVLHRLESGHYVRLSLRLLVTEIPEPMLGKRTQLFVDCRNTQASHAAFLLNQRNNGRPVNLDIVGNHPVAFLTFGRPVELAHTALASAGMDFMSFQSIVEVNDYRPGTRGAVVLEIKTPSKSSIYLLVAGRSGPPSHSRPDGSPLASHRGGAFGVNMNWLVDVFHTGGDGVRPLDWAAPALQPLLDQVPENHFGSWCKTPGIENILSWRVSPRGALFLHLEINQPETHITDQAQPAEEDLGRFNHLRKLHLDRNQLPMEKMYTQLFSPRPPGVGKTELPLDDDDD